MDIFVDVNWLAVIVAAVVRFALGGLWYSPAAFGKTWQETSGATMRPEQMPQVLVLQAIGGLVMAYILAWVIFHAGVADWWAGAVVGFLMWLGFIVPFMLPETLFQKRSISYFYVSSGYQLVALLLMGIIIAVW